MINDIDFLLKTSNVWNIDLFEWLLRIHCKQSHPYILQMIEMARGTTKDVYYFLVSITNCFELNCESNNKSLASH